MNAENQTHLINPHAMYRAKDCADLFRVGLSTWWGWSNDGKIERGIKIGPRTTVWTGEYLLTLREGFISTARKEG